MSQTIDSVDVQASCHCKAFCITIKFPSHTLPIASDICYCEKCVRSTGILFPGYVQLPEEQPIMANPTSPPASIKRYDSSRYFCTICGAHIAVYIKNRWFLATGTMSKVDGIVEIKYHGFVEETGDGGVTKFLPDGHPRYRRGADSSEWQPPATVPDEFKGIKEDKLSAKCHCGNLRLIIHRPSSAPLLQDGKDFLAKCGTQQDTWPASHCFCTSCRTTSGFPCNSWSFVAKTHVEIQTDTPLCNYKSSANVTRSFCGTCGATVFYDWEDRSWMYDIAMGLYEIKGQGQLKTLENWFTITKEIDYTEDALDTWLLNTLTQGIAT